MRKQALADVQMALSFTADEHFSPKLIELENRETGEVISLDKGQQSVRIPTGADALPNRIDKTLCIKERYNESNQTYHELSMVNTDLPRTSALKRRAKELDTGSVVRPIPGKVMGVQQSRLKIRGYHLMKNNPSAIRDHLIHVKVTEDGTRISSSIMHTVVIAFSIIEEKSNSPQSNHTVALLNTTEHYEHLSEALEEIRDEIEQISTIEVDGEVYRIEFFLGAEWKFLALNTGIESASATYSCIWCTCPSHDRHDVPKAWSVQDKQRGARTIEDIKTLATVKKRGREKFGCVRQPLFPSIPRDHIIPDVLHLFLRI